jgi:hypothetical protein
MTAADGTPLDDTARHSVEWYRRRLGDDLAPSGSRLLIPCDGGPTRATFETFPPRIEFEARGGVYVLDDDGPVHRWRYHFVSHFL